MDADIDLLVKNFKQLLKNGRSAHLDADCHAGQAWIGLHVRLGHVRDHEHGLRTRNGPSRQRRRMRRAAARPGVYKVTFCGCPPPGPLIRVPGEIN